MGRKWVNLAIELQEKFQGLNFDLPNMHLLIETLLRAVPALQCMVFASGGRYESNHVHNKKYIKTVSQNQGSTGERFAMKQCVAVESLRFMLLGGRWGPGLKYQLGTGFMQMRDKSQREHLPYPLFLSITPMLHQNFQKDYSCYVDSRWVPCSYSTPHIPLSHVASVSYHLSQQDKELLQSSFDQNYPSHGVRLQECEASYRIVSGFRRFDRPRSTVKAGDDVAVQFGPDLQYCRVTRFVDVIIDQKHFLFFFILWYSKARKSTRERYRQLPRLVRKWVDNNDSIIPLTPQQIQERVMMLHNCIRICSNVRCRNPCVCVQRCRIKYYCKKHKSYTCSLSSCSHSKMVHDVHCDLNEFLVIDSNCGFDEGF